MTVQKGKQGTKGQKQIVEENKGTLKFYSLLGTGCSAGHIGISFLFYWEQFTLLNWVMLGISIAIYLGCLQFMAHMAKAVYSETGQLVDGGIDLNMESGVSEHVKDLIILTGGCQLLSLVSTYFWLLLLLAPARALYMLWVNILAPWFFQSGPNEEVDEKKRRKMERKMARKYH